MEDQKKVTEKSCEELVNDIQIIESNFNVNTTTVSESISYILLIAEAIMKDC